MHRGTQRIVGPQCKKQPRFSGVDQSAPRPSSGSGAISAIAP